MLARVAALVAFILAASTAAQAQTWPSRPVTVIVPFIADQPFWGARMHARGLSPAPIPQRRLTPERLATALTNAEQYRPAAAAAASSMATEDGVGAALAVLAELV